MLGCFFLFIPRSFSSSFLRVFVVCEYYVGTAWGYQEPGSEPSERISLDTLSVQLVSCLDMTLELLVSEKESTFG